MAKTEKLDLYKQHKDEYAASKKAPTLVDVGPAKYLTIKGQGAPGGEDFQAKVQAMYASAFTIKMTRKSAGQDYRVCHLEGLWWSAKPDVPFCELPPDQCCWKLMIRVPEFITADDLAQARETLLAKKKGPEAAEVRLETIEEGRCVQMLHVGPYSTEHETIEKMAAFVAENSLQLAGLHHEIYLSDPRRVPPERLRTILRHPVTPAGG